MRRVTSTIFIDTDLTRAAARRFLLTATAAIDADLRINGHQAARA